MNIIESSHDLYVQGMSLDPISGIALLQWIEFNARISHKSEDRQMEESWRTFITTHVLQHGDWSVVEHASVSAIIRTDRGTTHELVRHRLASYTQESTRFVNGKKSYPNGLEFIRPAEMPSESFGIFNHACETAELVYFRMLELKTRPQEARSVLPNALAANISMTCNLRQWRHFFLMRTSRESHPDMRRIAIPMLAELKRCIPLLFDDIEPMARQIDNLQKGR